MVVDLEAGQAGNGSRDEVTVVTDDVDTFTLIRGAEQRLDALLMQPGELLVRRSGNHDSLLASPYRNSRLVQAGFRVALEHGDPAGFGSSRRDECREQS